MTITEATAGMTADERREYILAAFTALTLPEPFAVGRFTVTITAIGAADGKLVVTASVEPPIAQTLFEYGTPTVCAPDGTFTETMTEWGTFPTENVSENLPQALIAMLSNTIGGIP